MTLAALRDGDEEEMFGRCRCVGDKKPKPANTESMERMLTGRGVQFSVKDQEVHALVEVKQGGHLGEECGIEVEGDLVFVEDGESTIVAASSLTHCAEVLATRKINFMERWAREQIARCSKGGLVRGERTRLWSQEGIGLCTMGKVLRKPRRMWEVVRCVKTQKPSTGERKTLIVIRCTWTEEWERPDWWRWKRKSRRTGIEVELME